MGTGVERLKAAAVFLALAATLLLSGCDNPLLETVDGIIDEYEARLSGEQPEINVKWGSVDITDGDTQGLGNVDQEWPLQFDFTIENTGAVTLNLTDNPKVALSGGSRYTVISQPASSIGPGGSADFTIELDPGDTAGNPSVVVTIKNDDPDESSYDFTLSAAAGKYQGIKTLDSGGDVGEYSSIGVDEANVYIAYFDAANFDLKLATSRNGGYDWSTKAIASSGQVGSHCSLFVGGNDLYISYYDISNGNLRLARSDNAGESFTFETVDSGGDVGQYSSIDVGENNDIYIGYHDATNESFKVAKYDDSLGSWSIATWHDPASPAVAGRYVSIAESAGVHYASYHYSPGGGLEACELYRQHSNIVAGAVTSSATVDNGYCSSIEVVGSTVYISHFAVTSYSMVAGKVAIEISTNGGYNWNSYEIDSGGFGFWGMDGTIENKGFTSLAVDGDYLFVSYCAKDSVDDALKFARSSNGGSVWGTPVAIDTSNAHVGFYTSIAINGTNGRNVYISYHDEGNEKLKFARSADGGATWD